jgi:hypothetical protein
MKKSGLYLEPAVKKSGLYLEPARKKMFTQLTAQATELWRFALDAENGKLRLIGEKRGNRLQVADYR